MNILHLSRTMGQGGAEKVVIDLCENTKMFFDNVVVLSSGGVNVENIKENGVHHQVIPDLESKNIRDIVVTIIAIYKTIKKYNIDIIHTHHRMGAFYAQIAKVFNRKIHLVYTAHNVFYNKRMLTKVALLQTKIIAVGEGVKNNLTGFYHIQPSAIEVITNSVKCAGDRIMVRPVECEEDKLIISCIGRLSEQKGMEYLIRSIGEVISKDKTVNVLVLIIGDGEKKEELINLTEQLSLGNYIKFLGYRSNVYQYIRFSEFMVSSSLWEGFPLNLIECLSEGKTVIASNIVGNNEIIKDGYNGMLFKPKDIDELSNLIIKLSKDKELLLYLEKNAKETYTSRFCFESYVQRYIDMYVKFRVMR